MVSQQVRDYPLEFDQNFKNTTKINLFILFFMICILHNFLGFRMIKF
jgi:hypothetical protein